ncbi:MAG TPA: hypothetical protein VNZ56_05610, partial [Verrucomicrobiae bacterium]|nr:hypothetical protein [Verrucomicrobiae bacterium]
MAEPGSSELTAASQSRARPAAGARARPPIAGFVALVQAFLFAVHIALYATWSYFWDLADSPHAAQFQIAVAALSVSFVGASLLAHRYFNPVVRAIYTLASLWLGLVNFFFLAACACWVAYGVPLLFGVRLERHAVAAVCFGLGLLAGICAVVNAA